MYNIKDAFGESKCIKKGNFNIKDSFWKRKCIRKWMYKIKMLLGKVNVSEVNI